MGYLGKEVKGRAKRPEQQHISIRIRGGAADGKEQDEVQNQQNLLRMRKDLLKKQMIEEQKMSHFNRMKILTHWRKLLRLAKTE